MTGEWIRFALAALFLAGGIVMLALSMFGVYKLKFVLNRMHSAAMGDTLGMACVMLGLMIVSGFSLLTLKLAMTVALFWLVSPVASHLIARLEVSINDDITRYCQTMELGRVKSRKEK